MVHQKSDVPIASELEALVTCVVPKDNDIILADLVKDVLTSSKGKGSPLPLWLMHRPFK